MSRELPLPHVAVTLSQSFRGYCLQHTCLFSAGLLFRAPVDGCGREAEARCSWKERQFHMGSVWHSTEGFGPASAFLVTASFGGQRLNKQLSDACQAFCYAWGKQLSWHHAYARGAANSLARAGGPSPAGENGVRGRVRCKPELPAASSESLLLGVPHPQSERRSSV